MSTSRRDKQEIITFKADKSLLKAMKGIQNRSEFIRTAVLNALEQTCPLCNGNGTLTANQLDHWVKFSADHRIEECEHCHEMYLVCANSSRKAKRGKKSRE